MPGFNQRGPINEGPMTGKKQGACTGDINPGQKFTGSINTRGQNFGRRGCQGPGRRHGQRIGWGQNDDRWTDPAPSASNRDALKNRAQILEAELADIKNQLNKLS